MMLREQDDRSLHLLSVISPDWIGAGKSISVSHAPTMFGEVSFTLNSTSNSHAVLHLQTAFGPQLPNHLYLHLPWFIQVKSVVVDGRPVRPADGVVELPRGTKLVDLTWTKRAGIPAMSYAETVKDYKHDYATHYREYLRTGLPFAQ